MAAAPNLKDNANLPVPASSSGGDSRSDFDSRPRVDYGRPDTLRYNVMTLVVAADYEKSLKALNEFLEAPSPYPDFKPKAARFIRHCIDLVYAIRAKRNFPGMDSLTRSKQQELKEKYKTHLRELEDTLKRIERIHHDLQVKDVRSVVYVVKALWIAGIALVVLGFAIELIHGAAEASVIVMGDSTDRLVEWIFSFL